MGLDCKYYGLYAILQNYEIKILCRSETGAVMVFNVKSFSELSQQTACTKLENKSESDGDNIVTYELESCKLY